MTKGRLNVITERKHYCICCVKKVLNFLSCICSQGSGIIIIVGMSSGPFVNGAHHHLSMPPWHPQYPLKVAAGPAGQNSTLRSEVIFNL